MHTDYLVHAARYAKLQDQNAEAFKTLAEQKTLIEQLEDDLRSVNALSTLFRGDAEVLLVSATYLCCVCCC